MEVAQKPSQHWSGQGQREEPISGLTRTSPDDQNYHQSRVSTKSETHTSSPITQTQKQPKAQDQSIAPKPLSKASAAKQANELNNGVLRPPPAISRNVAMAKTEGTPPNSTAEMPVSIPGGVPNGVPNSVANIATDIPVAVSKVAPEKVRASSGVAQGLLVHQVTPKYPPLARQARIQGTVVLQAVIGKDGSVQNLHVLSGHPMLTPAAMDAVRQWRYKPYRVNGEPVEADTQINVATSRSRAGSPVQEKCRPDINRRAPAVAFGHAAFFARGYASDRRSCS